MMIITKFVLDRDDVYSISQGNDLVYGQNGDLFVEFCGQDEDSWGYKSIRVSIGEWFYEGCWDEATETWEFNITNYEPFVGGSWAE